jgi:prevent-host-death family protein
MSRTQLDEAVGTIEAVTITEFKEQLREVIDLVAECGAIAILRHKTPEAVLIPVDDYIELVKLRRERLNVLTQRYDDMISRMRTPDAAAGVDALFSATPEELGQAAVAAAKRG